MVGPASKRTGAPPLRSVAGWPRACLQATGIAPRWLRASRACEPRGLRASRACGPRCSARRGLASRAGSRRSGWGARAGDDALEVCACGQRAVLKAAVAAEACGTERVCDCCWRAAHEQRALQAQRHAFDDAPRALLERGWIGELPLELRHAGVELCVCALCLLDLLQEHLERARRACECAQHVKAHDVARALPDRCKRRLAVQPRHARLLYIAGAAKA